MEKKTRMKQYQIRIPNNEVKEEFMSLTAYYLKVSDTSLSDLFSALEEKQEKKFIQTYKSILLRVPSYNDLNNENSYQTPWPAVRMMMLGMCAWLQNDYEIISNREEGKGRCDLILKAKTQNLPSYVLEFKYTKNKRLNLCNLAKKAINQIIEEEYDHTLSGTIMHVGLAHRGKDVEMIWKERNQ